MIRKTIVPILIHSGISFIGIFLYLVKRRVNEIMAYAWNIVISVIMVVWFMLMFMVIIQIKEPRHL